MSRIIMHVDLNAFFARCEEIKDPSLVGKPVLIGNTGRAGIVSTCSYEARKFGCHSGEPMFEATKKCPHALVRPVDHRFYGLMSAAFFAYVEKYTRIIEKASIDECYADMSLAMKDCKNPEEYLEAFQRGLYRETQLYCSIGIAPTKWLAKMGSDLKKPNGITLIRKKDIENIIYPLPIESFWGIGKKTSPKLRQMGIATIGDLMRELKEKEEAMRSFFGKGYEDILACLEGKSSDRVVTEIADPKSIGNSETLMFDAEEEGSIFPIIHRLSLEVAERSKKEGMIGHTVTLSLKDTSFRLHSASHTTEARLSEAKDIEEAAIKLYEDKFAKEVEKGMKVRLVGVSLGKLENPRKATVQMSLWNYQDYEEMDKTKLLIADFNGKLKKPLLMKASEAGKEGK